MLQGCSIAGVYVGQMGLTSVQTYDLETVQKYVTSLITLGVCSMIVRFFWVADFILVVKQVLHKMHDEEQKKADDPSNTNSDGTPRQHIPDDKIILSYGIQVTTITITLMLS
jgi:hypothetical protein